MWDWQQCFLWFYEVDKHTDHSHMHTACCRCYSTKTFWKVTSQTCHKMSKVCMRCSYFQRRRKCEKKRPTSQIPQIHVLLTHSPYFGTKLPKPLQPSERLWRTLRRCWTHSLHWNIHCIEAASKLCSLFIIHFLFQSIVWRFPWQQWADIGDWLPWVRQSLA